ncbi:hypothetical protein PUN28_001390 [Cardiocondyla obscurior]|uniref:Secreted protein n=1 Tax=Cardiocondyla obscurior TaxID=286306 RepID=A0AAW2H4Q3_9HYME
MQASIHSSRILWHAISTYTYTLFRCCHRKFYRQLSMYYYERIRFLMYKNPGARCGGVVPSRISSCRRREDESKTLNDVRRSRKKKKETISVFI